MKGELSKSDFGIDLNLARVDLKVRLCIDTSVFLTRFCSSCKKIVSISFSNSWIGRLQALCMFSIPLVQCMTDLLCFELEKLFGR